MDVREAKVTAAESKIEFLMIEAHQMQNGGMEIVHMDSVFDSGQTKLVGSAVTHTTLDTSTCHPSRKTIMIMVTAFFSF